MTTLARSVTGGVDTHLDVHVAAALDERGTLLGVESFATTESGYKKLLGGSSEFAPLELVGVEGTDSYGAGLTRHLQAERVSVVEVDRPNRQRRRRKGKSDPEDAIAAAHAAQSGDACGEAKTRAETSNPCGFCAWLGPRPQGTDPGAQPDAQPGLDRSRAHPSRAPGPQRLSSPRASLDLSTRGQTCIVSLTKFALRTLARRALAVEEEITEIDAIVKPLVKETAPELISTLGVGTDAASALLVVAGDNPGRLRNEAAFAHLCGTSPLDASSGKNERHRLNRSGDRQANSALWHIVLTPMVYDPRTTEYIDRRKKEGLTKKEAVRCLKHYVAREGVRPPTSPETRA